MRAYCEQQLWCIMCPSLLQVLCALSRARHTKLRSKSVSIAKLKIVKQANNPSRPEKESRDFLVSYDLIHRHRLLVACVEKWLEFVRRRRRREQHSSRNVTFITRNLFQLT